MRNSNRSCLAWVGFLVAAGWCARSPLALAQQTDTNPPLPNVLLLLDNSGSMERMIDGTLPEDTPANTCDCNATTGACTWSSTISPNRWGMVTQAMTGNARQHFRPAI
jgi:type IV pilus assembly protein PilY1